MTNTSPEAVKELINRWNRLATETKEPTMYRVDHPHGKTWMADFLIETAEQTIELFTALSEQVQAPLPEDVEMACEFLRYWKPQAGARAADLIERLWRDCAMWERAANYWKDNWDDRQQRIEALESALRDYVHHKENCGYWSGDNWIEDGDFYSKFPQHRNLIESLRTEGGKDE